MKNKTDKKNFLDSNLVKIVSLVSSIISILGFLGIGGLLYYFNFNLDIKQIANQEQNVPIMNINGDGVIVESASRVKEVQNFDNDNSNWNDDRAMFTLDEDGFYCVKNRRSYQNDYYFIWNRKPIYFGEKSILRIKTNVNDKEQNNEQRDDSIVIAYADSLSPDPLYRMFFPANDSHLIGFDIDSLSKNESVEPSSIRLPFNIYKNEFEIQYQVDNVDGSNLAHFYYKLTYIPEDEEENKDFNEDDSFNVPMSINPKNSGPFMIGVGVRTNGPCFSVIMN